MKSFLENDANNAINLNMTPLIDMVFILLIFFVVTSSFVKESGVEVDRPSAQSAVKQQNMAIMISITAKGDIWIDQQNTPLSAVRSMILRLHADTPEGGIVISADKSAPSGRLVEVLDQIRLAGISNIAIATQETNG
ncbi:MAG: biopolymer transporter ExbD [Motiliproteus sp.]|nr:biopolymer transporter ExbD [Motiliproteus sp.]MCW9054292.1 biopolymer transporter ExbD [Motiliproteus sp.]